MKYAPGLMVGVLSGSLGSTTASHNRNGSYFRSRTIPVNVNSAAQIGVRNRFSNISQSWRNLTQLQREAWIAAALSVTLYDPLGVAYTPTGAQYFLSINTGVKIYSAAAAILASPPAPAPPAALLTAVFTIDPTEYSIVYTGTPLAASTKLVLEATRPISPGRKFIGRSEYKQIKVSAAAQASPFDASAEYLAIYGAPTTALNVASRAYVLKSDGQRSAYVFSLDEVA